MAWARAGIALGVVALGLAALSGGHRDDARTPAGPPGWPAPLFGVAVVGDGGRTGAVDAYGDLVDLRAPGPASRALVAVSSQRQIAGTAPVSSAIVPRVRLSDGRSLPLWRADVVRQGYVPGTNVLRTVAWFGDQRRVVVRRTGGPGEVRADRGWLARARALGSSAPRWARSMYRRSLLVLRALTDRRTGAVVAGARDGWAYVWPRDAAAVAMAFASAGYAPESQRVARFLLRLELNAAARFRGTGAPVPGRAAQGDAAGWVAAAARSAGLETPRAAGLDRPNAAVDGRQWRGLADYQEGGAGDYLGDALAGTFARGYGRPTSARGGEVAWLFGTARGLERIAGDPDSGLDTAAAWAVRPFALPALYPVARRTLLNLVAERQSRFGLIPSEGWHGGDDPWTAPTAWCAWSLAALWRIDRRAGRRQEAAADRRAALRLMADLRRAATPLGLLPERVDAQTGAPASTTPLAWSHAFAVLTIRTLWP